MKKGHILHVDDDDNDVFFLALAAEDVGIENSIHAASNGRQAIELLKSALTHSVHTPAALPCLTLLDVKLPVVTGIEVLRWIRQQPALNPVSVLILSGSDQSSHLELAHELGADSYFVKPGNLRERISFVRRLKAWLLGSGALPCSPGWRTACLNSPTRSSTVASSRQLPA